MQALVSEFTAEDPGWQAYLDHLTRLNMLNSATLHGEAKPDCVYLGIRAAGSIIVGHLSFRKQLITVPPSYLTGGHDLPLSAGAVPLYEAFVQTFGVEPEHRRQGYGRVLQETALAKASALSCYQMRSWSSADRRENYALKLSLGFLIQPVLYPMPGGQPISGVYFVKKT